MKHSVTLTYGTVGQQFSGALSQTGDIETNGDFAVSAGANNQLEAFSITQANLKSCLLLFNSTGNVGGTCTVKTNSSGSPQDTITLHDGVPVPYIVGGPVTIPFAGNVTALYITDGSTGSVGGTLTVRSLSQQ